MELLQLDFDAEKEATLVDIRGHVFSSCDSIWRPLLSPPEASAKKLCSPPSDLRP